MQVRAIRNAIKDLPDDGDVRLFMVSCPSDDLNVVLESVCPARTGKDLHIHVSVVNDCELEDET